MITCLILFAASLTGKPLLQQLSDEVNAIAVDAIPATVFIKTTFQPEFTAADPFQDDFFRRFFGNPQQQQPQTAGGSGFVIRQDGYIVTNNHVVQDASDITVILNDKREYKATVKGTDPRADLAVLKIEETDLPFLDFGDSDALRIGDFVIAIGNPFGLEASLSTGVVSAKGRQDLGITAFEDFIQTDAAINPGNSGGPLLNPDGKVIGVNTAIMTRSGGYMGIGLSIPSNMAQNIINQIIEGGSVKRAYLGVILQPLDKSLADAIGYDKIDGIVISEVLKDSPAAKAGLQQGDIIMAYNNTPVKSIAKFRNDIALMSPSSEITLLVYRDKKQITISAKLGSQSEGEINAGELIGKIGIEIENLTPEMARKVGCPDLEGVLISKVKPGSSAALAGIQPGFVITNIAFNNLHNQKRITSVEEFNTAMKDLGDKKYVILGIRHQNFQKYYTIKVN